MKFLDELKQSLKTAGQQITSTTPPLKKSSVNQREIYFTGNFIAKAKQWGLSEQDALDVFYYGEDRQATMRCRKYNGYELCIYHGQSKHTGQPYISTIWKRDRR